MNNGTDANYMFYVHLTIRGILLLQPFAIKGQIKQLSFVHQVERSLIFHRSFAMWMKTEKSINYIKWVYEIANWGAFNGNDNVSWENCFDVQHLTSWIGQVKSAS